MDDFRSRNPDIMFYSLSDPGTTSASSIGPVDFQGRLLHFLRCTIAIQARIFEAKKFSSIIPAVEVCTSVESLLVNLSSNPNVLGSAGQLRLG